MNLFRMGKAVNIASQVFGAALLMAAACSNSERPALCEVHIAVGPSAKCILEGDAYTCECVKGQAARA